MDIPKTLSECYEYLNNKLDEKRKEKIKKEGGSCEHFGLGLWIRNNWIYPNKNGKIFGKRYMLHVDDISSAILKGYHHYLNGKCMSLEELGFIEYDFDDE
jgi:hypothetical protein